MMKIYCIVCNKYRKFKKPKISQILRKTFGLFIICSKCGHEYKKIFKEEESSEILKSQEFRLKSIDEVRNCFIEKIN